MGHAAKLKDMKRSIQSNKTHRTVNLEMGRMLYGEDDGPLVLWAKKGPNGEEIVQYATIREVLAQAHVQTFQDDSIVAKRLRWAMRVRVKEAGDFLTVREIDAEAMDDLVSKVMPTLIAGQVHDYIIEMIEEAKQDENEQRLQSA